MRQLTSYLQENCTQVVLAYRAMAAEVDSTALHTDATLPFVVYAPACDALGNMEWRPSATPHWEKSNHGVLEPQGGSIWHSGLADTWVVCPLLGFNPEGHRIGMGKGYFDRWLSKNRHSINGCIGLAYACQQVENLPVEPHDERLDIIITEKGRITCLNS